MGMLKRFKKRRWPVPLVDNPDTMHRQREAENSLTTYLYDPPVDGKTPLDGEGNPQRSRFYLRDVPMKLGQGFTELPVAPEKVKK